MQKNVESYTRRTRKQKEHTNEHSIGRQFARLADSAIRGVLYALLRHTLKVKPIESKIPIEELRSILIIPYGDAIGDLLVALPVARAIRKRQARCKIGIVVSERNRSLVACEDSIDEKYVFGGRHDWKNIPELSRARRDGYQLVLNLHFTKLSDYGLIANYVGPKAIKVTLRMKRSHHYQLLFNRLSPFTRYKVHISQMSLAILEDVVDFGSYPLLLEEAALGHSICPQSLAAIAERIDSTLASAGARWFIYVNPQARNAEREWGFENIARLTARLVAKYPDLAVIVTSSPALRDETQKAVAASGQDRLLYVETGHELSELTAICRLSRLVISPDTAAVHLASAENKPVVELLADRREIHLEWLPLYCPSVLLSTATPDQSVRSISVDKVFDAVVSLLEGKTTRSATFNGERGALETPYQRSSGQMPIRDLLPELMIS